MTSTTKRLLLGSLVLAGAATFTILPALSGSPFDGSGQSGVGGGGPPSVSTGGNIYLNHPTDTVYLQYDGGSIGLVGAEVDVPNGFTDSQKVNPDLMITPFSVVAQAGSGQRAFGVAHTGARYYFDEAGNIYCYSDGARVVCASTWQIPTLETNTIGALTGGRDRVEIFYPQPYPLGSLHACDSDHKGVLQTLTTDGNAYQCNGTDNRGLLRYLRGSASLNYASIAAGADETLTLTVTGAATTDEVHCSALVSLGTGMALTQAWVSSADTVSITVGNIKLVTATDPGATTFACTVMGP